MSSALREAAQQALEAMRRAVPTGKITLYEWDKAVSDLSAALARIEWVEPLAQQAEPVEPVAKVELMMTGGNAGLATRIVEIDDHLRERLRPGQLLYTAPPQRKPLTEEEIIDAVRDADLDWAKGWTLDEMQGNRFATLARAIERAHGIGDSDE